MPRKYRVDLENERTRLARDADEKMHKLLQAAPAHVVTRLGQPPRIMVSVPAGFNWKSIQFCPDGQVAQHANFDIGRRAANASRQDEALLWAQRILKQYGDFLGTRGGAAKIARAEGVSPKRVRRARARLKANGQA